MCRPQARMENNSTGIDRAQTNSGAQRKTEEPIARTASSSIGSVNRSRFGGADVKFTLSARPAGKFRGRVQLNHRRQAPSRSTCFFLAAHHPAWGRVDQPYLLPIPGLGGRQQSSSCPRCPMRWAMLFDCPGRRTEPIDSAYCWESHTKT
jgi:hypothetical protein